MGFGLEVTSEPAIVNVVQLEPSGKMRFDSRAQTKGATKPGAHPMPTGMCGVGKRSLS